MILFYYLFYYLILFDTYDIYYFHSDFFVWVSEYEDTMFYVKIYLMYMQEIVFDIC